MMALLVIAIAAPYGFVEGLTLWHLKELEPAAKAALAATDLNGKVNYMKVMSFRSDTATVMCSATEKMDWGGVDKAVVRITLVKKNMKWTADKFQWVFSENRDKDGWTLPPYF